MSIISSPISKDNFNKLFEMYIERVQKHNQLLKLNEVTYFAAFVGASSYFDNLVSGIISPSQSLDDETINVILNSITKGKPPTLLAIQKIRTDYPHVQVDHPDSYIFNGDLTDFCSSFFPGTLPSINGVFIEYLLYKKIINVFGTYSKRFIIFKNWVLSEQDIDLITNKINIFDQRISSDFSETIKNYISVTDKTIDNYKIDQQYLLSIVDSLSKRVIELESALEIQQKEGIDGYLLRWH